MRDLAGEEPDGQRGPLPLGRDLRSRGEEARRRPATHRHDWQGRREFHGQREEGAARRHPAMQQGAEFNVVSEEDILLGELARLQTMLAKLEHDEEYEKASIIANKIKWLENKISRL